jgi:hypothetical protein
MTVVRSLMCTDNIWYSGPNMCAICTYIIWYSGPNTAVERTVYYSLKSHICIDGQVRLGRLIRFQTDNLRLFLHQQKDKQQTSVCTMSNGEQILFSV